MGQKGFSLVELVTVVCIIATLLTIATLSFDTYMKKSHVEAEIRTMYADLMNVRTQALLQKSVRSVQWNGAQFSVYPSSDGSGSPMLQKTFTYSATATSPLIAFDTRGVANIAGMQTVCVDPSGNPGNIDSLIISATSIQFGKLRTGEACSSDKVDAK